MPSVSRLDEKIISRNIIKNEILMRRRICHLIDICNQSNIVCKKTATYQHCLPRETANCHTHNI